MSVIVDGSTIVLTGTVDDGCWFWGDGFSAPDVIRALAQVGDSNDVTIRLNSGGGIASEGSAIHAALRRHAGRKTVVVEGIAASAAAAIVMAGDERVMTPGSVLMIHDPSNITFGTIADHERTIGELTAIASSIAGLYAGVTGQTAEQTRADMLAETWMTPEEAIAKGYATAIGTAQVSDGGAVVEIVPLTGANDDEPFEEVAPAAFAYAQYRHTPERLRAMASAGGWNSPPSKAAQAASNRQKEVSMPSPTHGGASASSEPAVADIEGARAEGRTATLAECSAIIDACALVGMPERASAFIKAGKSPADVSAELLQAKATASASTEIDPRHPAVAAAAGQTEGVDLVADMRRRNGVTEGA